MFIFRVKRRKERKEHVPALSPHSPLAFIDAYTKLVTQLGGLQEGSAGTAEASPTKTFLTAAPAALHKLPSAKGLVVRMLPPGSTVYPTGKQDGLWWEVADENDNVGWVLNTKLTPGR